MTNNGSHAMILIPTLLAPAECKGYLNWYRIQKQQLLNLYETEVIQIAGFKQELDDVTFSAQPTLLSYWDEQKPQHLYQSLCISCFSPNCLFFWQLPTVDGMQIMSKW